MRYHGTRVEEDDIFIRSCLKIRIFVRDQGETETQPAGILKYVEDLRRRLNADIGRKDFFEMASNNVSGYLQGNGLDTKASPHFYPRSPASAGYPYPHIGMRVYFSQETSFCALAQVKCQRELVDASCRNVVWLRK
jgi:hypothetical protein